MEQDKAEIYRAWYADWEKRKQSAAEKGIPFDNPELRTQLRLFRGIVQFALEFTEDAEETVLLETELIHAWQPKTNKNKLE